MLSCGRIDTPAPIPTLRPGGIQTMSTSAFVEQLYLTFFGRPADDAGRAHWSQAIESGAISAAEVTRQFLESAEFADSVAPVARLYYSAFDRIPDAAGLGFWLQHAQTGMPLDAIADAFALTPEFAEVYGAARNADFIDLIYQNALGRAPDAAGKAHWVEQLAQGNASRADVLGAIAASPEMAAATSAAIKVIAQYHGITGSAPTQQQIDSALLLDEPLTLINQMFASSRYTGAPVPHPFVTDHVATSHGGGETVIDTANRAPVIDTGATGSSGGVTPNIVLAFSQDVFAAGGMIYITDGAAQTVIDRVTKLPVVRIVGASDTRAIDVNDSDHVSFDGSQITITVSSALKSGVTYAVLIGKGVLVGANDMPFGGISDAGTLNFTPVGDSTPPAVVAFSLDRESLNAGHTATVTIEFSEAVHSPDASDFDIPYGTLSGFASADSGRTWTALFTPAASVEVTTNAITLRAGSIRDMAGNFNADAASSTNYAVDTIVTAVVDSKLEFNDTGISLVDRLTSDATQTLSGKFVGAPSGTTLKVVINSVAHDVAPNGDNTWSFSGGEFTEGLNTVIAYFTNPAGNTSAQRSLSFTLDTTGPAVIGGLSEPVDPTAAFAITFSEAVYWTNPEAEIVFESANGNVTVGVADLAFSADNTTVTIGANLLAPGTNYTATLPSALIDAAGNPVAEPLAFATSDQAADALGALDLLAIYDSGASSADNLTNGLPVAFSGSAEALATVNLYDVATSTLLATQAADADGKWTINFDSLPEGSLRLAVSQTDAAGNVSPMSPELALVVDKTAPSAPSALDLTAGGDSGASGTDNLTSIAAPAFSGAAATAGDLVKLYADGVEVGSSLVAADGKWYVAPTNALADGARSMTVQFTDKAGNVSAASSALGVTIDTTAPGAPTVLDLLGSSDSGSSLTDNITSETRPTFAGSAGTAGNTVKLYADGVEVASSLVASDGTWQMTPPSALTDGTRNMTVKYVDLAGNLSAASSALGVTIDTIAPTLADTTPDNEGAVADYIHLLFSEHIAFTSGELNIRTLDGGFAQLLQVIHDAAWEIGGAIGGDNLSNFTVLPDVASGHYELVIDPNTIADLAGNAYVPVVGVPAVTFYI